MWKINDIFINNPWNEKKVSREITKYIELSQNKNTTY